jgi:hypothetical protein
LHLDRAPHRIHHARELDQHPVPRGFDDPAMVFGDLGVDQRAAVCLEAFVRPLFVHPHQAGIAGHVGGEDRGQAADRGHFSPGARLARWSLPRNQRRP